jgi:hypothetical protein
LHRYAPSYSEEEEDEEEDEEDEEEEEKPLLGLIQNAAEDAAAAAAAENSDCFNKYTVGESHTYHNTGRVMLQTKNTHVTEDGTPKPQEDKNVQVLHFVVKITMLAATTHYGKHEKLFRMQVKSVRMERKPKGQQRVEEEELTNTYKRMPSDYTMLKSMQDSNPNPDRDPINPISDPKPNAGTVLLQAGLHAAHHSSVPSQEREEGHRGSQKGHCGWFLAPRQAASVRRYASFVRSA